MTLYRISITLLLFIIISCSGDSLSFTYSKRAIIPEMTSDIIDMSANIPTMAEVNLKFNTPMNRDSVINNLSFKRAGNIAFTDYTLYWSDDLNLKISISKDLKEFEWYIVELKKDCKNIHNYKPDDNYMVRFKTGSNDKIPPVLLYTDPTGDAVNIVKDKKIVMGFNEIVKSNTLIYKESIRITDELNNLIEGSINVNNNIVEFIPKYDYNPLHHYSLFISKDITDLNKNPLGIDYNIKFRIKGGYEVIKKIEVTRPTSIAFNSFDDLYITSRESFSPSINRITKYDSESHIKLLYFDTSWDVVDFFIDGSDDIYAMGTNYINIFDPNGYRLGFIGSIEENGEVKNGFFDRSKYPASVLNGMFGQLSSIYIDKDNAIYVTDIKKLKVIHLTKDGKIINSYDISSNFTTKDNYFASSILKYNDERFYIADNENDRVLVFDRSFSLVNSFGKHGTNSEDFNILKDIAKDNLGYIYALGAFKMQKFYPNGTFIASFGGLGLGEEQFNNANYINIDKKGTIYIADYGNNAVKIIKEKY